MPDTADATAILLAAAAAQGGPGDTLRIVLLVSMVGGVLLAWFLLRGYRSDDGGADREADGATDGEAGGGTDGGTSREGVDNTDKSANA